MSAKKIKGDMIKPVLLVYDEVLFPGCEIDVDFTLGIPLTGSRWVFGMALKSDLLKTPLVVKDTALGNFVVVPGVGGSLDVAQLRIEEIDTIGFQPGEYAFDVQVEDAQDRRFRVATCASLTFGQSISSFDETS